MGPRFDCSFSKLVIKVVSVVAGTFSHPMTRWEVPVILVIRWAAWSGENTSLEAPVATHITWVK
jgi:hypothetical protein